jgi:hypothetical protein
MLQSGGAKVGGMHKGGSQRSGLGPLLWGEPVHEARQRFLLAKQRVPAWGEPSPPRFAPGGNGKGGSMAFSIRRG